MSIEEKRRAAFEAAFKLPDGMYWDESQRQYAGGVMFWLYTDRLQVWNAALDSIAIELPTPVSPEQPDDAIDDSWMDSHSGELRMRSKCVRAIEAVGLKVAP